MISKIIVFACAIACTALCIRLNSQQHARAEHAEPELTAIAIQSRLIGNEIARAKKKLADAENESQVLKQSIALLQKIEFVDSTVQAKTEETAKKESDSIADQEQKARGYHAHLVSQYAPFNYRVGLTNEQIDQLEIILTDHWQSTADITAVMETKKMDDDDPSVIELHKSTDGALDRAEKELLGEDGFQQLHEYERSLPARDFVASVAEQLYYTDTPLTADQASKLTQFLADNCTPYKNGGKVAMDNTDWPAVLHDLGTVLAPKQCTAFLNTYNLTVVMPQTFETFGTKTAALFKSLKTEPDSKDK